jgi:hypothetical protein
MSLIDNPAYKDYNEKGMHCHTVVMKSKHFPQKQKIYSASLFPMPAWL